MSDYFCVCVFPTFHHPRPLSDKTSENQKAKNNIRKARLAPWWKAVMTMGDEEQTERRRMMSEERWKRPKLLRPTVNISNISQRGVSGQSHHAGENGTFSHVCRGDGTNVVNRTAWPDAPRSSGRSGVSENSKLGTTRFLMTVASCLLSICTAISTQPKNPNRRHCYYTVDLSNESHRVWGPSLTATLPPTFNCNICDKHCATEERLRRDWSRCRRHGSRTL